MHFHETIAAISTPIGEGGIAIIRVSGLKAKEIGLFILRSSKGQTFKDFNDHHLYYGKVINPQTGQTLDEVLFFYSRSPHSYTAEDVLEIQAHGGTMGISRIMEVVLQNGARLAEPGEFTERAYLNGRIDLVQAESIIDLIRAKTEKAHQIALSQLTGKATQEISELEESLYQILISIEAILDFPEEGLPELQRESILGKTIAIEERLHTLLINIEEGRKIRDGIMIVIVGRPNAGKSSLLNAFLQEERAIVTEIPGTTRDVIESQLQLRGIPVRLIDTAGIRSTENPIEQIGIEKAEQYLNEADLILFIIDGNRPLSNDERMIRQKIAERPFLLIVNKIDLPRQVHAEDLLSLQADTVLELSLKTKEGLKQLEETLIQRVGLGKTSVDDRPLLSRIRHKQALENALDALKSFHQGLQTGISEDLLAVDLRTCLEAVASVTGKKVSEEVIHGIFDQFCIGK
jgi:tRNA modification GTPase TrmE